MHATTFFFRKKKKMHATRLIIHRNMHATTFFLRKKKDACYKVNNTQFMYKIIYEVKRKQSLTILSFLQCCLPLWVIGYVCKIQLLSSHGSDQKGEKKEARNQFWKCV